MTRSEIMCAVKASDTKPELLVRNFLKVEGIIFQTYGTLPGKPDIILKDRKAIIRVMGCFWHKHFCKNGDRLPKSNVAYWSAKIEKNCVRDKKNKRDLKRLGWRVIDVWECQLRKVGWRTRLRRKLSSQLVSYNERIAPPEQTTATVCATPRPSSAAARPSCRGG
ncbi:MAG: very short patch repair endonuclease [Bdellovibrionales bacterium]